LFDYIRLFLSAVEKLPKEKVTVYRGVARAAKEMQPAGLYTEKGELVTLWPINSTAKLMDRVADFVGDSGPRTILTLECTQAVDVQPFSAMATKESEYLLVPGSEFEVVAVLPQGDLTLVQLREDDAGGFAGNIL
jgi:hypothetical protein